MKKIFSTSLIVMASLFVFTSCEKEEDKAILNTNAVPSIQLSANTVVLTKDNADKDAVTLSWPKPDYGFSAAASYTILIDKKGGTFVAPVSITTNTGLTKTFKTSELNAILIKLGLVAGTAGDIDIRVVSNVGDNTSKTSFTSPTISLKATPYLDKLDLTTIWGVVGSAAVNGWNGPDMPFYKTDKTDEIVAYVTLLDGEIKFRSNNKWDVNYGDDGANGTLESGGANIKVTAGTYKITFNTASLTYTIEKYSWGLVGSATPSGWNAPDVPLTYDPTTDTWKATAFLKAGEIKVRKNEDWGVNYGGTAGTLVLSGDNIAVTEGNYNITIDFKKMKFTVEATKPWGVVGDAAPNGWNGPDVKFRPDFYTENVFVIDNVTLGTGEIKFRYNDAWAVNYGDDGADGNLEAGGANIKVTAGKYKIILDLSNASKPKYTLTKK
ncbi:SusE domain-containing protein [Flectobacillus roseus]|uniref:SusE domain-containing protein n=1 Tax=Flectobacillus roseus TaxID=502259 RepID=A0ABT6Y2N1_9BACT|nr:SusE domain-containing protein [Flectobacillus roseus]MDI9857815.1 SusE domain-containing protein [Flectobacillus roseus]